MKNTAWSSWLSREHKDFVRRSDTCAKTADIASIWCIRDIWANQWLRNWTINWRSNGSTRWRTAGHTFTRNTNHTRQGGARCDWNKTVETSLLKNTTCSSWLSRDHKDFVRRSDTCARTADIASIWCIRDVWANQLRNSTA